MNEDKSALFGERDQELLFKAFAHFAARTTKKSINIIIGMIRLCIQEVIASSNMSIPETKKLDENKRRLLLESGIDEFLRRAKVGSVHQRAIKTGCMTIYERWRDIRKAIKEEQDIHLEEILDDPTSQIIGYDDQEVLLSAFTHYITQVTGKERSGVIKLIRICMLEVTIPQRVNFKETRYLDEETRREMVCAGIEEYLKRTRLEGSQADIIRSDCMKVYERWKEIRRVDPMREDIDVPELVGNRTVLSHLPLRS